MYSVYDTEISSLRCVVYTSGNKAFGVYKSVNGTPISKRICNWNDGISIEEIRKIAAKINLEFLLQATSAEKLDTRFNYEDFSILENNGNKDKLQQIKKSAKARGLEFNLTDEHIWSVFTKQNGKCAYTGVDLNFSKKGYKTQSTASIDRIDNSKGYIIGNIQWVHTVINRIKWSMEEYDFINWCKLVAYNNPSF